MVVKGECGVDVPSLHENFARTVGKAPLFILESPKDVPRSFDFFDSQVKQFCHTSFHHGMTETKSLLALLTGLEKSQRFIENVIGEYKTNLVRGDPVSCTLM